MNAAKNFQMGFDPSRPCDDLRWNCIDFALCNSNAHRVFQDFLKQFNDDALKAFRLTCDFLQIKAVQIDFTDKLDQYNDKIVICFYWWEETDRTWGFHYTDYHFLRKIDGQWIGKDGQNSVPEVFPQDHQEHVFHRYDADKKAMFVITE